MVQQTKADAVAAYLSPLAPAFLRPPTNLKPQQKSSERRH